MTRLFAYGTLELPELVLAITGRRFASEPALLEGFARSLLRGECYPGIAPAAGAQTAGTLYRGVDPRSLAALDRFEGSRYELRRVRVRTADGPREAATWILREELRHLLGDEPWDPRHFAARHLRTWIEAVGEFRA